MERRTDYLWAEQAAAAGEAAEAEVAFQGAIDQAEDEVPLAAGEADPPPVAPVPEVPADGEAHRAAVPVEDCSAAVLAATVREPDEVRQAVAGVAHPILQEDSSGTITIHNKDQWVEELLPHQIEQRSLSIIKTIQTTETISKEDIHQGITAATETIPDVAWAVAD